MKKIIDLQKEGGVELEIKCNIMISKETTSTGNPYLGIHLSDSTGHIKINIWDSSSDYTKYQGLVTPAVAVVKCKYLGIVKGYPLYEASNITLCKQYSINECVDIEKMKDNLRFIISNIEDSELKRIIHNLFKDEEVREKIFTSPISDKNAGSFKGGLLANILRSCHLSLNIAETFNCWDYNLDSAYVNINSDLLITASVIANLGAIDSFEIVGSNILKTLEGNMNEQSFISYKRLFNLLQESTLSEDKKIYLENVVSSCKGSLEYGALNVSRTIESHIFQCIQRLEYTMSTFEYLDRVSFEDFSKLQPYDIQKKYFIKGY